MQQDFPRSQRSSFYNFPIMFYSYITLGTSFNLLCPDMVPMSVLKQHTNVRKQGIKDGNHAPAPCVLLFDLAWPPISPCLIGILQVCLTVAIRSETDPCTLADKHQRARQIVVQASNQCVHKVHMFLCRNQCVCNISALQHT